MQGAARANRGCPCVSPVKWRFVLDKCCEYSDNAVLPHDPNVEPLCNRFLLRSSCHYGTKAGGCTCGDKVSSFFKTSFSTGAENCFAFNTVYYVFELFLSVARSAKSGMLPEEWTCDWHDHAVRRSESGLVGECLRKPLFVVSAGRWLDFLFSIRRSRRRSTEKSAEEGTLVSRGRLSKQIDAVLRHKDRRCNEDCLLFGS
jgi:hypothetical protein